MDVIGAEEYIGIPSLTDEKIHAKIDTGADSCALHCKSVEVITKDGETKLAVAFRFKHKTIKTTFSRFRMVTVTSSNGIREKRYKIKLDITIGKYLHKKVPFTLTDRSSLKFRILLGKNFLRGKYLVDVGKHYLLS